MRSSEISQPVVPGESPEDDRLRSLLGWDEFAVESPYRSVWQAIETLSQRLEIRAQKEMIAQVYREICSSSLRSRPSRASHRQSVITGHGVPFEFSFTTSDPLGSFRMLSEATPASCSLEERVAGTMECLRRLDKACRLNCDWAKIEKILEALFPESFEALDDSWYNGAMWISARFAKDRPVVIRIYANQQINNNAYRFQKIKTAARLLGPQNDGAWLDTLLPVVDPWAHVSGVSFDLMPSAVAGLRIYLGAYAGGPAHIAELLRFLGLSEHEPQVWEFLEAMRLGSAGFAGPSLLVSFPVAATAETVPSMKFDVTSRELFSCDRDVYEVTDRLFHRLGLHSMGFRAAEDLFFPASSNNRDSMGALQYVGLRVSRRNRPQINTYLALPERSPAARTHRIAHNVHAPARGKPTARADATAITGAAVRAASFLLGSQSPGGGWWDLTVCAGSTGPWLTGVVGEILQKSARVLPGLEFDSVLAKAIAYLRRAENESGGWGYNEALPPDCDSTACAMLFLHAAGQAVNERSIDALLGFQGKTGAFLTYPAPPPGHSWGQVHHDVHPSGVRALAREFGSDHPTVRRALDIIDQGMRADPIWPAFWWKTSLYSLYVNLLCLNELGEQHRIPVDVRVRLLDRLRTGTPFETALACLACLMLERNEGECFWMSAAGKLLASQRDDGSWEASRLLRVVNKDCAAPWAEPSDVIAGPAYCDHRRVLSTAFALGALVRVLLRVTGARTS